MEIIYGADDDVYSIHISLSGFIILFCFVCKIYIPSWRYYLGENPIGSRLFPEPEHTKVKDLTLVSRSAHRTKQKSYKCDSQLITGYLSE